MLRLRPYKACDAKSIVSWIGDEETFRKWSADCFKVYPLTAQDLNRYYDHFKYKDYYFQMTAYDDYGPVGHMIMRFLDKEKQILRFGFFIIDDTRRGNGYGKEMLRLAVNYAFTILRVQKVTLGVFENNPEALHCYQSPGFRESQDTEAHICHLMGQDWTCLELELKQRSVKDAGEVI